MDLRSVKFKNNFNLYEHQIKVIKWMDELEFKTNKYGMTGGILHLEMGLGNTLISLTFSLISDKEMIIESYSRFYKKKTRSYPTLILCSKIILNIWKYHIDTFFGPEIKYIIYHRDYITEYEFNNINREDILQNDFIITTYDICSRNCKPYIKDILITDIYRSHKIYGYDNRNKFQADNYKTVGPDILFKKP